jgi:hypothetical protein
MKPLRLLAAFLVTTLLSVAASAADISGRWTWPMQGRNGNVTEAHATLLFKDGVLTGTVSGRMGEAPIGDASFLDGKVAFTVTREVDGNKIVIKYAGQLEGDTITGKIERPAANEYDAPFVFDWKGTRQP